MKSLFKLAPIYLMFFLFSKEACARDVILVENLSSKEAGEMLLKILDEKFHIPKKLIVYKRQALGCSQKSEAILHLCLKANGEMDIIKIDRFVVENSLSVFFEKGESL